MVNKLRRGSSLATGIPWSADIEALRLRAGSSAQPAALGVIPKRHGSAGC